MLFFRDADTDTIYESVRTVQAFVEQEGVGLEAYNIFAGVRRGLTDAERIRTAKGKFELAGVMNAICPYIAALKDVFRLHADNGGLGAYAGVHIWGGFIPTVDTPTAAMPIRQDATLYTMVRLVDKYISMTPDEMTKADGNVRIFLQKSEFTPEEIDKIESDISLLGAMRIGGQMDRFGALLWHKPAHSVVLHQALEIACGIQDPEKEKNLFTSMEIYTVSLGHLLDNSEADLSRQMVLHRFRARPLNALIAGGDIGGNHHIAQKGSSVRYQFAATREGAQAAANALMPLRVYDARARKIEAANMII